MPEDTKALESKDSKKQQFNLNNVINEVGKFTRKVNSLSKVFDFTIVEIMPKLFKENIEEALLVSKKNLDNIMRHLI